jgi:hypothetical protein
MEYRSGRNVITTHRLESTSSPIKKVRRRNLKNIGFLPSSDDSSFVTGTELFVDGSVAQI